MPPSPELSAHTRSRNPSAIRVASIRFAERRDGAQAVNVAIGNVSREIHPAMRRRLEGMGGPDSPFREGVVRYTPTVGTEEARAAFLQVLASSGCSTEGLHVQITDGGSQAMELVILACCGPAGSAERPLLLIDANYPNYRSFAERLGRATVSLQRTLDEDGRFSLPSPEALEAVVARHRPGALVVIPYDNPTGAFYPQEALVELARLAVRHNLWMISDEAYRELYYEGDQPSSVWRITEEEVPGIGGRRISIETASKVWNACGLRIGALVTDHAELHRRCVAENTASLCPSALGQWVFGALAGQTVEALRGWYTSQRQDYRAMMVRFREQLLELLPEAVVGRPSASLYTVVDFRRLVDDRFDALEFVLDCAAEGAVSWGGQPWTLLTAPMGEFYDPAPGEPNPGRTQVRVAFVEPPEVMERVPGLLVELLRAYLARRQA